MALASMDLKGEAKRAFETALSLEPRYNISMPLGCLQTQGSISFAEACSSASSAGDMGL